MAKPKWYVVELLFARRPDTPGATVMCESSDVLFQAGSGNAAYDRAIEWAIERGASAGFDFVGIRHVQGLSDAPGDGVEIGGRFFELEDPWTRMSEVVPPRNEIPAIVLESSPDAPLAELLADDVEDLEELFPDNERGKLPN